MNKIYISFMLIFGLLVAGCSSTQYGQNDGYDDVYYSDRDYEYDDEVEQTTTHNSSTQSDQTNQEVSRFENPSTTETYTDGNGDTYVTNNYYDDYYDYSYSSRIRRFHQPYSSFNYYNSYYTNSYWYNYNPFSYGVSIYLGYNWWNPHPYNFNPHWGNSYYGSYGYSPFSYYWSNPYYCSSPFYSSYGGYGYGYYNGYNSGYYNGFNDGYYGSPYYYNSYDGSGNIFYGHSGSTSSNTPNYPKTPRSLGNIYQEANVGKSTYAPANYTPPIKNAGNTVKSNPTGIPADNSGKGKTTGTPGEVPKGKSATSTPSTNHNTPRGTKSNTYTPSKNTDSNTPRKNTGNTNYTPPSKNNNNYNKPRNNNNTPRYNNTPRKNNSPNKNYGAPRSNLNGSGTPSKSVYKNKPSRSYSSSGSSTLNSIKKAVVHKPKSSRTTNTAHNTSPSQKRR